MVKIDNYKKMRFLALPLSKGVYFSVMAKIIKLLNVVFFVRVIFLHMEFTIVWYISSYIYIYSIY